MIEQKEFLEVIKMLEENYNKKLSDNIIKVWYEEFKNYDLDKFRKMIVDSIKEYPYFPTINQVKQTKSEIVYETI